MSDHPDMEAVQGAMASGAYLLGDVEGRWKCIKLEWPIVYMTVTSARRENAPDTYTFRFECTNYPITAPDAVVWDLGRSEVAQGSSRPAGTGRVQTAFSRSDGSVYLPCFRQWVVHFGQHPWQWAPEKGLVFCLELLFNLLHSAEYSGSASPRSPA